jgi:hypothetical protein
MAGPYGTSEIPHGQVGRCVRPIDQGGHMRLIFKAHECCLDAEMGMEDSEG